MFGCNMEYTVFWDKKKHDEGFRGAPLHTHSTHELYFLISGTTNYFICDEFFTLHSGDMIFVPQDTLHQTEYTNNNGVERIVFSFDSDYIDKNLHSYLKEMSSDKYISFNQHGLLKILDILNKIENEIKSDKRGSEEMQRLYFQQLLILISRYRNRENEASASSLSQFVQKILIYINENHHTDITLSSLSKTFAISPSHLSKSFKSCTGLGVKEYINVSRINAAKALLETTNLSVTDIATKCGFNNSNYFTAVFKKIIGTTPKKYKSINSDK